jgi:dihydroorotase
MTANTLIKNVKVVNEGSIQESDVWIKKGRIEKVAPSIDVDSVEGAKIVDGGGKHLIPGMIDDQVHFREPGWTRKGDILSESRAAVAGGITTYMEMPNTNPQTITFDELEKKFERAHDVSLANYSFYMGATNDNLDVIKQVGDSRACGVKIFMGASTGNMLVDQHATLDGIFKECPILVATHCEDTPMIQANEAIYKEKYGDEMEIFHHAQIRSAEACYKSSSMAVSLAKKHGAKLHVLHLTTAKEMELFEAGPMENKTITAEVCVHHLFFEESDYHTRGTKIKWNPSIKSVEDRDALRKALLEDRLDIIATDHAPHTLEEKGKPYWQAPSGGPLVQHAVPAMLDLVSQGVLSIEKMVQKACHAPAIRYGVKERGFIREGYWADLALVDLEKVTDVDKEPCLYKCDWSPFEGLALKGRVEATFVNGNMVYNGKEVTMGPWGEALEFDR